MFGIVYCATNKINNKVYIGQTTQNLNKRIKQHFRDCYRRKTYFYSALLLYKAEDFLWEEIDQASSKEELNQKEIYWITKYKANDRSLGYNTHEGGCGGAQTNPEVLLAMSIATKGKILSEEIKKKISIANKGKRIGKENPMYGRAGWNKGLKTGPLSAEHKRKVGKAHRGIKKSEECKEKIRQKAIGRIVSREVVEKIRQKKIGSHVSPQALINLQESKKCKRKPVQCVESRRIYSYVNDAETETGINKEVIRQCCLGHYKTAGNFHWQWVDITIRK
jgi:group I intron endonuclease